MNRTDRSNCLIACLLALVLLGGCVSNSYYPETIPGEFRLAEMYAGNKQFNEAISIYERIIVSNRDSEYSDRANFEIAEINRQFFREYETALNYYESVFYSPVDSEYDDDAYYYAAKIYENQIKDMGKAKSTYQNLINKYPDSRYRNEAAEALNRIQAMGY